MQLLATFARCDFQKFSATTVTAIKCFQIKKCNDFVKNGKGNAQKVESWILGSGQELGHKSVKHAGNWPIFDLSCGHLDQFVAYSGEVELP